ncbi:diguanylate cyclase [Maridesulfovibrio sp.]|uniref:diguanylate cyclase n=1 Tax=Maridesulfovibrio sp. TaxID=2795000 RepID=UPI003BAA2391
MERKFYKEVLESLTDGVYFTNLDRKVTYWNKAAERLSGYSATEVVGKSCADNVLRHVDENGIELCIEGCPLAATMEDGEIRETNVFMHHKFGHRVPVFVRASPMRDENGQIVGAVEVFTDNSKNLDMLREMEELRKEVLTDQLTKVGNRRYASIIMERLEDSLQKEDVSFGVLFVDLDHFKNVNDTWGHHVGDLVLQMAAKTLKAALRPLDVVCRWGGEEFVILIPNIESEGLAVLAERVRMLVENSWVDHEGERISVTASFGGAVAEQGEVAESVVDRADKQVYLSKESGRNCIHIGGVKV